MPQCQTGCCWQYLTTVLTPQQKSWISKGSVIIPDKDELTFDAVKTNLTHRRTQVLSPCFFMLCRVGRAQGLGGGSVTGQLGCFRLETSQD